MLFRSLTDVPGDLSVTAVATMPRYYANAIQFDAPVNPGNSGGALIAADGRVVGITGLIFNRFGVPFHSGVGFAIPSDEVLRFAAALKSGRPAERGALRWLSASRRPDGSEAVVATGFGSRATSANQAALNEIGVRDGDRVVAIDGQPVRVFADCVGRLFRRYAGETAVVSFERNGQPIGVATVIIERFAD